MAYVTALPCFWRRSLQPPPRPGTIRVGTDPCRMVKAGLDDPAPILFRLGADPMLDHSLHLARVVTLVDAVNGADNLDRFAEAGRQAALADTLVITKTDLAPLGSDLVGRLDALNDRAERMFAAD